MNSFTSEGKNPVAYQATCHSAGYTTRDHKRTIGPAVQRTDIPPLQTATTGFQLHPVASKLLLVFHPAEGRRLSWTEHAVSYRLATFLQMARGDQRMETWKFRLDLCTHDCIVGAGGGVDCIVHPCSSQCFNAAWQSNQSFVGAMSSWPLDLLWGRPAIIANAHLTKARSILPAIYTILYSGQGIK